MLGNGFSHSAGKSMDLPLGPAGAFDLSGVLNNWQILPLWRWRYGLAIAATIAALMIRWALDPLLGARVPWITLYPAVGYAAIELGAGPAVVSLVLGLLGANYFIAPLRGIALPQLNGAMTLVFLVGSGLLIFFGGLRQRTLLQLQHSRSQLSQAKMELEQKVEERTAELRALSAGILRVRDEERRHIARELHDSTGQVLSALKLTLASFEEMVEDIPKADLLLSDARALADQAVEEIRTTSYLLHPPLLEELGFSSAARWYVDGFSKRSGIRAQLDLPTFRMSPEAELVFFRVLQESLANVLRHSGSKTVRINLESDGENLALFVRDQGNGIPSKRLHTFQDTQAGVGVGLAGMHERVRAFGGQLKITSDSGGTCVVVTLPLTKSAKIAQPSEELAAVPVAQ